MVKHLFTCDNWELFAIVESGYILHIVLYFRVDGYKMYVTVLKLQYSRLY